MLKLTNLLIATILLSACGDNINPENPKADTNAIDTLAIINDPNTNLNIQTRSFSEIDTSGILMFPLSIGQSGNADNYLDYDRSSANSFWNIIFYDSRTETHHLLSERKMLISSIDAGYNSSNSSNGVPAIAVSKQNIFYKVVVDDYNQDKKLSYDDPEYLFITDKQGNNFRQISPAGCNVVSWQYIKSTNKILMIVMKDTDKNKKFGDKDEVATYQIDIDKENNPSDIFSAEFKKKLKVMFDKDWKKEKE